MRYRNPESVVWEMWRKGEDLTRIVEKISEKTMLSLYISLIFCVDYLHREKGMQFTQRQLRRAFRYVRGDIDNHDIKGAWNFLLQKAGL